MSTVVLLFWSIVFACGVLVRRCGVFCGDDGDDGDDDDGDQIKPSQVMSRSDKPIPQTSHVVAAK